MDKFSALKEVAEKAKELGGINNYKKGKDAVAAFIAAANPATVLALLAELEAKDSEIDAANARVDVMCAKAMNLTERAETAEQRIAELEAKTAMTMGVGSGNGNLFVHGDYDSIKAAQAIVFENESLRAKAVRAAGFTVEGDEQ